MSRPAAVLLALFVVANTTEAQEPHKIWWDFLKGSWTYEISISPAYSKGTVTWRLAAKGNALLARIEGEDGSVGMEISGWRADTKTLVATGYGSEGGYWDIDLKKVTPTVIEGPHHGVLQDGRSYKGTFTGKRVDDDHYEWHFKGKTDNGEELSMTGKFVRKTEAEK